MKILHERIFGSKEKSLSQEEMKTRKEEENLFSTLPQLPALLSSISDILDDNPHDDTHLDLSSSAKKRRSSK